LEKNGKDIGSIFQGAYDIVSWDPRGVGTFTIPGSVTCFESGQEEDGFFQHSIIRSINYTILGKFDQQDQDELFSLTDQSANLLVDFGRRCQQGPVGRNLQYIGTSSTIRDLVSLADDIVGPGSPIDFWGLGYGSIIGINFINMFPERAGHVILDGVPDPQSWASYKLGRPTIADAEKTCNVFGDLCVAAGKDNCKLLDLLDEGAKLEDMQKLVANGHDTAVRLLRAGYTGVPVLPGQMMDALRNTLEKPSTWGPFANGLAHDLFVTIFQAAKSLDIPTGANYHLPSGPPPLAATPPSNTPQAPSSHSKEAIIGADNYADVENNVTMQDVLKQIVNVSQEVTQPFGAIWDTGYNYGWPARSVERLPAFDFSKARNPVLVIGNSADPRTPFLGAQNAATLLGNYSTLVEHLGSGHTSLAETSTCTRTLIANYLLSSRLPTAPSGSHITCEINPTVIFPPLGGGGDNNTSGGGNNTSGGDNTTTSASGNNGGVSLFQYPLSLHVFLLVSLFFLV
jgi:pimeloyl-ACP methyl ester carboxylesterase